MYLKRLFWLTLLGTLLLATGLRFYQLDAQSFWNDEGNSARLVERPLPLIIAGAAGDIHPPGYYLLLHAWRSLIGETEFALRAYSALCGVLTVAVTAAVGKRVGGWATALGAAGFVAIHPLAIYYSQEARMYAQLGLVSILTLWAAMRTVEVDSKNAREVRSRFTPYLLPFSLSIALGLYTQYAYSFALFGLNVAFGLWWLTSRPWDWRLLWTWISAHALGGLLFVPWAPIALRASGWRPPDLDAAPAFQALTRTLMVGITLPADTGNYIISMLGVLIGIAVLTRVKQPFFKWATLGMALMPAALILGLGIYRPAYLKFLMASVSPVGVLLTLPFTPHPQRASRLRRWSSLLLLGTLLPMSAIALNNLYHNAAYARDNYRAIATRITEEGRGAEDAARLGDAVILSAPNQWEVFTYYYRGPLPVYPAPYRPNAADVEVWLDAVLAQHNRVFVLFWGDTESDPERLIEPRLAQRAYKARDAWLTSIRVALYGVGDLPPTPLNVTNYNLGTDIVLTGYNVPAHTFEAGDIVPLTLFWQTAVVPQERYKVFIHLVDETGALQAQTDTEPGSGFNITAQWPVAQPIADRYGVLLPPDIGAGDYTLLVGMYSFAGERLPITLEAQPLGDALPLTQISVVKGE